jgi:hypothetical protein
LSDRPSSEAPASGAPELSRVSPQLTLLLRRALAGDPGLVQLWFEQQVLDRYRQQQGARVIRTNTAGRIRIAGGWSLDFGISDDDRLIHLPLSDLSQRVPSGEVAHWLSFAVSPPVSSTFLIMRLGAGSCMDDGELRAW